jgi:hypothetical protein
MGDRPTRDLERQGGTTGPLNRDEFPNYINPLPFSRIRSRPPVVCVKFSKRGFVVWRFGGFRRFMGRV